MSVSWKHTTFRPSTTELARMKAQLPDYRNWYYIECLEAADGWDDGDNHILVKFYSPDGVQTVHGEPVHYEHSRIETFNFCDYADKSRWQVAGLEKIIKELKDRLTKLESGV